MGSDAETPRVERRQDPRRLEPGGSQDLDVIVIGGGLAGIAATSALVDRGAYVLMLESESELGGKVRKRDVKGIESPRGPMVFEARRTAIRALIDKLGLSDRIVRVPAQSRYVVKNGKLLQLAPGPKVLTDFEVLSLRARLDLLSEPMRAWFARKQTAVPGEDESVAAFFRRSFGANLTDSLVLALVNGIWAGDPEQLSARVCFPDLVNAHAEGRGVVLGMLKRMLTLSPGPKGTLALEGGLWQIGARAKEKLPVRVSTRVERIDVVDGGVVVTANGQELRARACIIATEAPTASLLLRAALPEVANALEQIEYAPLAVVHWRETTAGSAKLPRGFGWLAPPREGRDALGTMFVSDLVDGIPAVDVHGAAPQARRFATFVGGALARDRAQLADADLHALVAREVSALSGGSVDEVLAIERWPLAVAQPVRGHAERMRAIERGLAESPIVVAGSYLGAGAMKDAVESGFRAAEHALKQARAPVLAIVDANAVKKRANVPVVIVGASYRDASTEARAKLVALEQSPEAPSHALVRAGYADAVVLVETCSRVEWVISSPRADFAADLLVSAVAARSDHVRVHRKSGPAALHYLLRVAMGLDSVAEGEPAVGRQIARAFELANVEHRTDPALRLVWRALQQLLAERRKRGIMKNGVGVQSLLVDEARRRGITGGVVAVYGQGEIGVAVASSLRDAGFTVKPHRRATTAEFMIDAQTADLVAVCTGAPTRYLDLPARTAAAGTAAHSVGGARGAAPGGLVIDIGAPQQVRSAPGWTLVTLEGLLTQPRAMLDDDQREWLGTQVKLASDRLSQELSAPPPKGALGAIDDERKTFLREKLPPLLATLPPQTAEDVRKAVATFAHTLMERVREEGRGAAGEARDARDARDERDARNAHEARDARDAREARTARDREARERDAREVRAARAALTLGDDDEIDDDDDVRSAG